MKKVIAIVTVAGMLGTMGVSSAWAGRVAERQERQAKRIHQGVHSGELTRGETRSLVKQQHRIQHSKRRAWSDGKLTPKERVRLEVQQDKASRRIYRFKHNDNQQQ